MNTDTDFEGEGALRRENGGQALLTRYATYRVAVVLVVVVGRIHIGTIEVQVVGVVSIVRSRGPVVAVAALVVEAVPIRFLPTI